MYPVSSVCDDDLCRQRNNALGSYHVDKPYLKYFIISSQEQTVHLNARTLIFSAQLEPHLILLASEDHSNQSKQSVNPDINLSAKVTSLINNGISQVRVMSLQYSYNSSLCIFISSLSSHLERQQAWKPSFEESNARCQVVSQYVVSPPLLHI